MFSPKHIKTKQIVKKYNYYLFRHKYFFYIDIVFVFLYISFTIIIELINIAILRTFIIFNNLIIKVYCLIKIIIPCH